MVLKSIIYKARIITLSQILCIKYRTVIQLMSRKKLNIMDDKDCIKFINSTHYFIEGNEELWNKFLEDSVNLIGILNTLRINKIKFQKEQLKTKIEAKKREKLEARKQQMND
jgi:hypothetical protein